MLHVLEVLMRNYQPILAHFENPASDREASGTIEVRAKPVTQSLQRYSMLLLSYLMLDIFHRLKHHNLLFQQKGLSLHMFSDRLHTTTVALVATQVRNHCLKLSVIMC